MVEVLEVNDIAELAQFRLCWNSLLPGTPRASFFHTLDWLETYWQHFGDGQKLRVLVVRADGRPLGILPLCVRREPYRLTTVRVLTYPLDNWGTWFGPIGPNPAATMMAASQHLRRTPRDWDMLELRWVGPESIDGGRSSRALRVAGLLSEKQTYEATSLVDLSQGWDDYLSAKSRKLRHEFRRILRRAFEDGRVRYVRHRPGPAAAGDGDPAWDLYAMCEYVAAASWQAASTVGNTLTHPQVRDYFRAAHAAAARLGMVDLGLLLVDDRPTAFTYNYHHQGRVTGIRVGFDPALDRAGLGSALMLKTIEDGCRRGDESFDLGPGEWTFKRRLRTHIETNYRLTYTPLASWRSQAVRWGRWAKRRWQTEEPVPRPAVAAL